ncbi:MAG: TRAP transporter small permease [Deltaproteobacteria bacterium]|nr:TRAP transporter small permease [Deltaproteobacteria bacterium]
MSFQGVAARCDRIIHPLIRFIGFIAGGTLFFMMVLVACDVILRFFNRPISGAYELIEYSMAVTVSFSVTVCAHQGGHIAVDILTDAFKQTVKRVLACLMTILAIAYTMSITLMTASQIQEVYTTGITSAVLRISVYPFIFSVAFAFLITLIVFFLDLLSLAAEIEKKWTR